MKRITVLTTLEHEDLPRCDVRLNLLGCEGRSGKVRRPDLVDLGPSLVQNPPRPLQPLLIDGVLPSSLRSSDRSMDQSAGGSQLKRESEVSVDHGVGLKVGGLGPGIWRIKRRQCLFEQSEIKVGPMMDKSRKRKEKRGRWT